MFRSYTDGGNIGCAEWLADPQIFLKRAQARTSIQMLFAISR